MSASAPTNEQMEEMDRLVYASMHELVFVNQFADQGDFEEAAQALMMAHINLDRIGEIITPHDPSNAKGEECKNEVKKRVCAACGNEAEGNCIFYRDGHLKGTQAILCDHCVLSRTMPTLETIWARIDDRRSRATERDFSCFLCSDSTTPLYCLNCAEKALASAKPTARSRVRPLPGKEGTCR